MSSLPRPFGAYQLLEYLGGGASGDVYVARRGGEEPVVVKCLRGEHSGNSDFIRRFVHEGEVAKRVSGPHVAMLLDVGVVEGTPFIAMEYVRGLPLSKVLLEMDARAMRPPIDIAMGIVAGATAGLVAIHSASGEDGRPLDIVHRDVAPKNIIVGLDGVVRVIDLGFGRSNRREWETATGVIIGSLGYMAPEQVLGGPIDQRIDVYAMGVVLFELLTVRRFITPGPLPAMVRAAEAPTFIRPSTIRSGVAPAIDRIIERAVRHKPEERQRSSADLLADLRAAHACATPAAIAAFIEETCASSLGQPRLSSRIPQGPTVPNRPAREPETLLGRAAPDEIATPISTRAVDMEFERTDPPDAETVGYGEVDTVTHGEVLGAETLPPEVRREPKTQTVVVSGEDRALVRPVKANGNALVIVLSISIGVIAGMAIMALVR